MEIRFGGKREGNYVFWKMVMLEHGIIVYIYAFVYWVMLTALSHTYLLTFIILFIYRLFPCSISQKATVIIYLLLHVKSIPPSRLPLDPAFRLGGILA